MRPSEIPTKKFITLTTGGDPPSVEKPRGPYPTFVRQKSGKVVPVVQAFCFSKYVGKFDLFFDSHGNLQEPVNGAGVRDASPVLLDKYVGQDQVAQELIDEYRPYMINFTSTIGVTLTLLRRNGLWESNLGNAITDSMVQEGEWEDATIGLINNGGIRQGSVSND